MDSILDFIQRWAVATWDMVVDSALLLLIAFVLAGVVHLLLNAGNIRRLIAGSRFAQVVKTALVGIPLPLCSCSVLPVAYQLRQAGVSKAGTSSFLISTPESGVDSIILTYSLMDPMMTVARPVTAFATALAAGGLESLVPERPEKDENQADPAGSSCSDSCCSCESDQPVSIRAEERPLVRRIWDGIRFSFNDLLNDLALYLIVGYALAGIVGAVFGDRMLDLPEWLSSGWGGYLGAMVVGTPLYICATSSTPLAAALVVAGFSPGAVLVFLMVGPATNVASLAVVGKILKGWGLVRYLVAIVVVALIAGLAVDWIYGSFNIPVAFRAGEAHTSSWLHVGAAVIFTALVLRVAVRKAYVRLTRRTSAVSHA